MLLILAVFISRDCYGVSTSLKKLRVGVYDNPPKVYIDSSGQAAGIFPEVLNIIADQEGWDVEYVQCSWQACLEWLEQGRLDIMVDIASSEERQKRFLFSRESVFLNWGTVYTGKGVQADSLLDLNGKTIATVKEDIHTVGEEGIERLAEKFDLDINFLPVDSYHEVLAMVEAGRADGGVVNRLFGALTELDYDIEKTPIVFNPVHLKFAFPKKDKYASLARTIDEYVTRFKNDPDSLFYTIVNTYLAGGNFDPAVYREMRPIRLTDEEQQWLSRHKIIRLGVDKGYAPYSFRDESGTYQGIAVDLINLISSYLDITIEVVEGLEWPEILEYAGEKKLDAILTAVATPERREYLEFTRIYLPTPLVITTRDDNHEIDGPENLSGKRVALVEGYFSSNLAMHDHPEIIPVMVDTPLDGLAAVSTGEVDCYIGVLGVVDYTARVNGIANLKIAARYNMLLYGESIATRKDWPELSGILDKALNAITEKKRLELHQSWIAALANLEGPALLQQRNALSAEETAWVKEHRKILLGVDPEFAPFEFIDDKGEYRGIVSEYLRILEKRLGLGFEVVPGLSWKEAVGQARKGKIDMLPCVGKNAERQEFLLFSKPYLNFQRVIITRADTPFISSMEDIEGMTVAVQKESSHEGYLKESTVVQAIPYPTLQKTLKAVSDGEVYAMVGNLSSSIYWIRKENYTNLKIAGPVSYASEQLHFAVQKNLPELVGILEKGLASLTPLKEKEIREKWITVDYNPGLDPARIVRYLLQGLVLVALAFGLFWVWNYRLKKEIAKRTDELEKTNSRLVEEISSRKQAEAEKETMQEQLFQAQKIESIGALAGGIAHDFNNILSSILGYSELALRDVEKNSQLQASLKQVYTAGLRAKDLVGQILNLSRRDRSQIKPIRVAELMHEALKMLRSTIPVSIDIKEKITREPLVVEMDPTQLHQVVVNLATNAKQAMAEENGVLEVSLSRVDFPSASEVKGGDLPPGQYAMITVSDTGAGIAPQNLDKIFEPYFTTKEKGAGTGLGLSVVNGIVKRSHGHITVFSEIGRGTTFKVYLPIVREMAADVEDNSVTPLPKGTERILFIDDEIPIAAMEKKSLERLGYKVTAVTSSLEALEIFQSTPERFDLVITDMTMPTMSGDEVAEKIKAIRPELPVLLSTGYSQKINLFPENMAVDGFLIKPVDMAEMARTIRKLLDEQ